MDEKKRKTTTSAAVKNRYNAKAYDRIVLCMKKGYKERIKEKADSLGVSVNKYISDLIVADLEL